MATPYVPYSRPGWLVMSEYIIVVGPLNLRVVYEISGMVCRFYC